MNYRHIYHAGNFADLVKHITLIAILNSLRKKEKPFAVLDAFAGLGVYDLSSDEATRTLESNNGIGRLLSTEIDNDLVRQYLDLVINCHSREGRNPGDSISGTRLVGQGDITFYPGSPWIINSLLREQDRLIASELHPQDYAHLKHLFRRDNRVAVHHLNAYKAVKAFVPFKENRGLILLDPPFEVRDEFEKLVEALKLIHRRASSICGMIWYPMKDTTAVKAFYHDCRQIEFKEILIIEFELKLQLAGLTKCGVLITNPPFIQAEITEVMENLKKDIYQDKADFDISLISSI